MSLLLRILGELNVIHFVHVRHQIQIFHNQVKPMKSYKLMADVRGKF